MSHDEEMKDLLLAARRKVAVVEEQNQALREQNSRLTLALDEALALARQYRRDAHPGMDDGGHEL
jgi:hypothetical protein